MDSTYQAILEELDGAAAALKLRDLSAVRRHLESAMVEVTDLEELERE